MHALGYEDFGM